MDSLKRKQKEFNKAMDLYNGSFFYKNFNKLVSFLIIISQVLVAFHIFYLNIHFFYIMLYILTSYLLADFLNGLIHMYMDHNSSYSSIIGPFIASFHLHHLKPRYKTRNVLLVYFFESGSKYWLLVLYIIIIVLNYFNLINSHLYLLVALFGFFSAFAEVSHYLCHNSKSKFVLAFQKCRIILPRKHHNLHHRKDNINYAFLNGVTDPIINFIAKKIYKGYKNNTDLHYLKYIGKNSDNR